MSCRDFDALIARSGQLTPEETARLDAHLASCGSCRELARAVKPLGDTALAATRTPDTQLDVHATGATAGGDAHELPETRRYRITGEVGRGGLGRVMYAVDQVLDRPVALKELFSTNAGMRRRFLREALITARLQHPSIVPIYDAGHLGDRSPFYAMKLVAGDPFDKSIANATSLTQRLALVSTVLAVADAIAYAHSQRIIHRDLKPGNILVGKYGETIVIDWGLAKDLSGDDPDALDAGPYRAAGLDRTVAGVVMGTPAYMAPEQASGEAVDERADVYALGAILYHVLSGAPPHEGNTLEQMVQRVISGEIRPLLQREPDVPRDLAAIVTKAMALEPSARYANAQGLADDLRRFVTGQLVGSYVYATRELIRRWVKRHRTAVAVALTALVVVGVVATVSVMRIVRARHEADASAAVAIQERAIAQQERNSATELLADQLAEQGRQELLAGRPARAAVLLSEAQTRSRDAAVWVRSLLAEAMRALDAQRLSLDVGPLDAAALSPDGTRIVTASGATAKLWDAATGTVVATLTGHPQRIAWVSFSPDGARIATVSRPEDSFQPPPSLDNSARLWDARTGNLIASFDHGEVLSSVSFSPDGTRLVTTGSSTARIWDVKTAQRLVSLQREDLPSVSVFSADGTRVVTAGGGHTAEVWDPATGAHLLSLHDGHDRDHHVYAAAFSPDGRTIVTASEDQTAKLWNARTGQLLVSLVGHTGPVYSAEFRRDGARVLTASADHTAKLWDARTGTLVRSLEGHTAEVYSAKLSADGRYVITASQDHTAKLWEADTGRLVGSYESHRDAVNLASASADGTQILTASADGTVKMWDARPSKLRVPLDGAAKLTAAAFSRDGARLVTTAKGDPTAKLWDARSGKLLASLDGHRSDVQAVAFDVAGAQVVTTSDDHTAKLWDGKTGKLLRSLDHPDLVRFAAFSRDGTRVATACWDHAVRIWNVQSGEMIAKLDHATDVSATVFSMDGLRVITVSDGRARAWRADNGALIAELGEANARVVGSDGERVITTTPEPGQMFGRIAKVWDAGTGKLVASLDGKTMVFHAKVSPDGSRVLTTHEGHAAKVWDTRTGKLLASLDGHTDHIVDAAFSGDPTDTRVVTASADNTAKLWDTRTGKLLGSLDIEIEDLPVAFSADGKSVLVASSGAIRVWDVHLEARDRDAVSRVIKDRDPWTFANGGLAPAPGGP